MAVEKLRTTQPPDETPTPHARMAIAVDAHVSLPTVDRVYTGRTVQQSLYERIRDSVERLGYAEVYPIPPHVRVQRLIRKD